MKTEATRWQLRGVPFQVLLIGAFLYRTMYFVLSDVPIWLQCISLAGSILMGWCIYVLYLKNMRVKGLISSGPFRFTRHPMYTGIALMDARFWTGWSAFDPAFIVSATLLYAGLFAAAWCQEKETLARFGKAAADYYARTPRLALLYPFFLMRSRL